MEACIGESIAKVVLGFVDHVAVRPVHHAVADHRRQLLNTSVPGNHQPPSRVEFTGQHTHYCIARLYMNRYNVSLKKYYFMLNQVAYMSSLAV